MDEPNEPKQGRTHTTRSSPFAWIKGASVRQLYDDLTDYGPDTARVEVHIHGHIVRLDSIHLHVVSADDERLPPINDSHICPIDCP